MTDHLPTPSDLIATESLLDDLARNDERSAPAGFEDRIFAASRDALEPAHAERSGPPVVIARIGPMPRGWATPTRIAAMIALLATVATVWLAVDRTPAAPAQGVTLASGVELTLDDWIEVEALLDDGLGDRLDTLYAETALVADESDDADWWDFDVSTNGESL